MILPILWKIFYLNFEKVIDICIVVEVKCIQKYVKHSYFVLKNNGTQ